MAAKTTSVELKGDKVQARSLAEAHVPRLMFDFRRNQSFQDLKIYSETKKFFDQTGAYVGTVYMQSVNGAENIVVSCDAGKLAKPEEKHEAQVTPLPLARLVPCMRSKDNQYWVACLSGTFEGPYKLFKNVTGITAADMEDNVEANIDGQFMSTDGEYYLFFVAQTGLLPASLTSDNTDPGPNYQPSLDAVSEIVCQIDDVAPILTECPAGNQFYTILPNYVGVIYGDWSYKNTGSTGYIDRYIVFGDVNNYLPEAYVGQYTSYSQTYHTKAGSGVDSFFIRWGGGLFPTGCDFHNVQVPDYTDHAQEWALDSARDTYEAVGWQGGTSGNRADIVYQETSNNMFNGRFAVRMEQAYRNKFCCGYTKLNQTTHDITTVTASACTADADGEVNNSTITEYSDYFQVNSRPYLLQGPMTAHTPTYSTGSNMMKYYGTDSLAETTGLMSAVLAKPGDDDIAYHYVGPNNKNELTVTVFVATGVPKKHTIPKMLDVDGNLVEFYGEIFLGRLDTAIEEKVQLY